MKIIILIIVCVIINCGKRVSIEEVSIGDRVTNGVFKFTVLDISPTKINIIVDGGKGGRIITHDVFEKGYKKIGHRPSKVVTKRDTVLNYFSEWNQVN